MALVHNKPARLLWSLGLRVARARARGSTWAEHYLDSYAIGDYVDLQALRSRFATQMSASARKLHSRNGWGFAAGAMAIASLTTF